MQSHQSPPLKPFKLANFRDVDRSGNATAYVDFLDRFASQFHEMIDMGIDLLELSPGDSVLDVGCGPGAVLPTLAARVGPQGHSVGIDLSVELVEEARRRLDHTDLPIKADLGDAQSLDFDDATFDAARADRVLVFCPDPRAAVIEMARVVRPGGRIVVTEPDLGATMLDAADVVTTREVLTGAAEMFVNGWMGRRLRGLFMEAGLVNVELRCFSAPTTGYAEWNSKFGIDEVLRSAVASGRIPPDHAVAWVEDLRTRDANGRFLACTTLCMVAGTRPR